MRVSIDATPLLLHSAGVKTYVYHWTQGLKSQAVEHQVSLFPFLDVAFSGGGERFHPKSVLGLVPTLARLGFVHAANAVPFLSSSVDVFHASHQLLRPPRNTKITATLYDMTCWLEPETHTPGNVQGARRFAEAVLARASGLISISESTRDDSVRILGLDPDKIEVIYPGVSDAFFAAAPIRRKKPYLLFVGTIEPRKNVDTLLDAYTSIPVKLRLEFDLVLAGPPGWGDPPALRRLRAGIPGVEYLGYVPDADLPGLTAGAAAFVYPSLYEGFGLPVAQAMAAGVPVITSNLSSLPEVAGDAALLVDPRSVAELASAMEKMLLSPSLRAELGARGATRAQAFRWDVCAQKSWKFFEKVISRR